MKRLLAFLCCALCFVSGAAAYAYPTINVKTDCGALGDGTTNDTAAFQSAATMLETAGGGTLVIPSGTYIVGQQTHTAGDSQYYRTASIFNVSNLNTLTIEGNNATLKQADGLRYGSFDRLTGAVYNPTTLPFVDSRYSAETGNILQVNQSLDVLIKDLTLDGNSGNYILGGQWGDSGRQIRGSGISLGKCKDVTIENVYTHHHGLDGIYIGWSGLTATDAATPHTLRNVTSEYNGRQGLSWVGGRGLSVYDSKFNHTGRGALASSPTAGVDIETTASVCRDGYFENCEFLNNGGPGMAAPAGDGGYTTFKGCTFWGTTSWSIWCSRPALKFESCNVYGSATHTYGSTDPTLATGFLGCNFEDTPWTNGQVYRSGYLYDTSEGGENVTWEDCSFIANAQKPVWIGDNTNHEYLTNCNFTFKNATYVDKSYVSVIRGSFISGCHFMESFPLGSTNRYYINVGSTTVVGGSSGGDTIVDGPLVRWRNPTLGQLGIILPGTYNS